VVDRYVLVAVSLTRDGVEASGAIRHETLALCSADLDAEVGLGAGAELALTTLRGVRRDNSITDLNVSNALTDGLNDTCTFVTKDAWEDTLRVVAHESVTIGVADTSVEDTDADLVCLRRVNTDLLNGERLIGSPADSSKAFNRLASVVLVLARHDYAGVFDT